MHNQRTRADVLAIAAVGLLTGIAVLPLLAAEDRARELANRSSCAANLRGITQSMLVYAAENDDAFPAYPGTSLTAYDASAKGEPTKGKTQDDALEQAYKTGLFANNPIASLWILVLRGQVPPAAFICKSDPFAGPPSLQLSNEKKFLMNFDRPQSNSYSVAYIWGTPGLKGQINPGEWWKDTSDATLPLASDIAPYIGAKAAPGEIATRPATAPAGDTPSTHPDGGLVLGAEHYQAATANNSPNHLQEGQNVGFADGHVEFARGANAGQQGDNLWTQTVDGLEQPIEAGTLPAAIGTHKPPFDTVMVPTRTAKGDLR